MTDDRQPLIATGSQTVGPFFHVGPARTDEHGRMAAGDTAGERIRLRIGVFDGDGEPLPDALIELWQADARGLYSSAASAHERALTPFSGFGRLGTAEDGWCTFDTIRPGPVSAGESEPRQASHINVCVFARGLLRHLYTRIYFDDDPALASDALLSIVPEDRRRTLLATSADRLTWTFRVTLQGHDETVFFDL